MPTFYARCELSPLATDARLRKQTSPQFAVEVEGDTLAAAVWHLEQRGRLLSDLGLCKLMIKDASSTRISSEGSGLELDQWIGQEMLTWLKKSRRDD